MRARVFDLIGQDSATAEDAWDNARIDRFLNRAAQEIAQIVKRHAPEEFTKTATFNTVVDQREYNLLTTCTGFQDLHLIERAATGSSRPEPLVVDNAFRRGHEFIPNRCYLRAHYLGFYVAPSEAKQLTVHYAPDVETMSINTSDLSSVSFQDPRIRGPFHNAIVCRAAYQAIMAESGNYMPLKQEAREAEVEMIRTLKRRRRGVQWMSVSKRLVQRF